MTTNLPVLSVDHECSLKARDHEQPGRYGAPPRGSEGNYRADSSIRKPKSIRLGGEPEESSLTRYSSSFASEPLIDEAELEIEQGDTIEIDIATGRRIRKIRKPKRDCLTPADAAEEETLVETITDAPLEAEEFVVDIATGRRVRKIRKPKSTRPGDKPACKDGKPMLRQGDTGDWIATFEGHKGAVWGVSLTDDGTIAASGSADFEAKIWDTSDGSVIHSFVCKHIVRSVNFGFISDRLLAAGNEKSARLFDLNNYDATPIEYYGHTGSIRQALFYDNDKRFVTASEDKTVRFWDALSGLEVKRVELKETPVSMELSQNKSVLTICYGNKVSFWSVANTQLVKEFEMPTQILSASMHPDNLVFICGGEDFKVYKCDFLTGAELESFKGHFGPVHTVRFSPDGEIYASGSEDGTVRLWQTTIGKTYGLWTVV